MDRLVWVGKYRQQAYPGERFARFGGKAAVSHVVGDNTADLSRVGRLAGKVVGSIQPPAGS